MVNPAPYGGEQLVGLFRDLSDRVGLPLMVQDASGNAPAEVLLQAVDAAASITCLKLESAGTPEKIGVVVDGLRQRGMLGDGAAREITVLGGGNGNLLPEELGRGSVGTMPHPALIDGFRTVCDRYAAGDLRRWSGLLSAHDCAGAAGRHREWRRIGDAVAPEDTFSACWYPS